MVSQSPAIEINDRKADSRYSGVREQIKMAARWFSTRKEKSYDSNGLLLT